MTNKEKYFEIINFRLNTPMPDGVYGEQHHIVPKSICPILQKASQNLVLLTAQEHFKAHYYLWKWFVDEGETRWAKKMLFAFHLMKKQLTKCDNVEAMSKLYEEARLSFSQAISELHKTRKRRKWTAEERKKLSEAHKGKKMSAE